MRAHSGRKEGRRDLRINEANIDHRMKTAPRDGSTNFGGWVIEQGDSGYRYLTEAILTLRAENAAKRFIPKTLGSLDCGLLSRLEESAGMLLRESLTVC